MKVLFFQGHVLKMRHSFTAQILKLLEKPSVSLVKKFAILFSKPDRSQTEPMFEPLLRMRLDYTATIICNLASVRWVQHVYVWWAVQPRLCAVGAATLCVVGGATSPLCGGCSTSTCGGRCNLAFVR